MADKTAMREAAAPQTQSAGAQPMLGAPGSDLRWLLPILLSVSVFALAMYITVFMPMRHAADVEPDIVIKAILSDNLFLLQIRMWIILLTAALLGGAMAVAGARQSAKALVRLELRLRRVASGETDLPPTDAARDFTQFDEIFPALFAAIDRASRRNHPVLQEAQRALRNVSQQIASGKATLEDIRKSIPGVLNALDVALDTRRRPGAVKL